MSIFSVYPLSIRNHFIFIIFLLYSIKLNNNNNINKITLSIIYIYSAIYEQHFISKLLPNNYKTTTHLHTERRDPLFSNQPRPNDQFFLWTHPSATGARDKRNRRRRSKIAKSRREHGRRYAALSGHRLEWQLLLLRFSLILLIDYSIKSCNISRNHPYILININSVSVSYLIIIF